MLNRLTHLVVVAALLLAGAITNAQAVSTDVTPAERLDALVERLDARTRTDMKLSNELVALLEAEAGLLASVPALLRSNRPSPDSADTLILAVERIGTPAAQQVLEQISGDPGQRQLDRLRAVVAAGSVSSPTDDTLDSLWGLEQQRFDPLTVDLANTAALSLGIAGSNLRLTEPARYPLLRDGLLTSLVHTTDRVERIALLKAIGNLNDPGLALDVEPWLFDSSASVRASAAMAVGLLRNDDSRATLLSALGTESRGAVRAQIVWSLRRLAADEATLRAVNAMVLGEPHPEASAEMTRYLCEHLDSFQEARPTLLELYRNANTKKVRVLAAKALA